MLPRADYGEVVDEPCCRTACWRPPTNAFVVVGCDVDRQARAVECTYTVDVKGPRTRRYVASQGSDDTRYDDED